MRDPGQPCFVTVESGLKISVRQWGQESADACVLLHGVAEGSFVWRTFAQALKPACRVLAIDLRGHGDSDSDPLKNYSFEAHVADVVEVLSQLNLKRFVLVGHSLGGDIAGRIAGVSPEGNCGMVLVDSGPGDNESGRALLYNQILESHRSYHSVKSYADWLLERQFLANSDVINEIAGLALRQSDDIYVPKFDPAVANILLQEDSEDWWWPMLKRCSVPVLLVRGVGSAFLSKLTSTRMLASLPRGKLATVQYAGHSVMTDNPAGFIEAVAPFVLACFEQVG